MKNKNSIFFTVAILLSALLTTHLIADCLLPSAHANATEEPVRFVFIGHIRGGAPYKINGLLPAFCREVQGLKKDFVFIGGDMIFGYENSYNKDGLTKEWQLVDEHLNTIDAPVYRIPGNHDWHSLATKEVYNSRYGSEYYSFRDRYLLVIAINASILYPDPSLDWAHKTTEAPGPLKREGTLDAEQLAFLKKELRAGEEDATIHDILICTSTPLLWQLKFWEKEISPLLKKSPKTRLILSGDAMATPFPVMEYKDHIPYLNCGWSIVDDGICSERVFYLHVIWPSDATTPDIFVRYVNMTPGHQLLPAKEEIRTTSLKKRIKTYIRNFFAHVTAWAAHKERKGPTR